MKQSWRSLLLSTSVCGQGLCSLPVIWQHFLLAWAAGSGCCGMTTFALSHAATAALYRNCACSESDTHPLLQAHLLLTGMHVLSGAARQQMRPRKVPSLSTTLQLPGQSPPQGRNRQQQQQRPGRFRPRQQGLLPGLARDLGRQAPHPPGRVWGSHSRSRAGRQRPRRMLLTRHSQAGRLQAQAWKLGLSTVAAKWAPGAPTRGLAAGC